MPEHDPEKLQTFQSEMEIRLNPVSIMMRSARRARLELRSVVLASFETPTVGRLLMTGSLHKRPGGGRVSGQLKSFGKGRENVMKNLLFFTAAALLLVESTVAYAEPPSVNMIERSDKWNGMEQREVWGPPQPPAAPRAAASFGCHNVRVRIATQNGHTV